MAAARSVLVSDVKRLPLNLSVAAEPEPAAVGTAVLVMTLPLVGSGWGSDRTGGARSMSLLCAGFDVSSITAHNACRA